MTTFAITPKGADFCGNEWENGPTRYVKADTLETILNKFPEYSFYVRPIHIQTLEQVEQQEFYERMMK